MEIRVVLFEQRKLLFKQHNQIDLYVLRKRICLEANLWTLHDGINLAKSIGITKLIIECDATEAVKLLSSNSYSNRLFNLILNDYRSSIWAFQEIKIQHCFREANKAIDLLAKVGYYQATPLLTYFYPPNDLTQIALLFVPLA